MSDSPRLVDLVPRRSSTFLAIFSAGVLLNLLLGGLYAIGFRLAHLTTDGKLAALDLDSEGSIASWCGIVLLFTCGLTTLLVRRLRMAASCPPTERQLWAAVSILWFTMSLDEGASLHEAFKEMMARLTGTRILGDGSVYWVVPYFLLHSASGFFVFRAARGCPAAIASLFGAGISYAIAVIAQLEFIVGNHPAIETWIEESCEMLGNLFILVTLGLYARWLVVQMEQACDAESAGEREKGSRGEGIVPCAAARNEPKRPHWTLTAEALDQERFS